MEPRLEALKLVLDHVGAPAEPSTLIDRVFMQKALYLIQAAGVRFGYHFGWYLRGPYSTALTKDYFGLSNGTAPSGFERKRIPDFIKVKLDKVKVLSEVPLSLEVALNKGEWLELVASFHYLRTTGAMNSEKAKEILRKEKPRLAPYADLAESKLSTSGLLG